MQEGLFSIKAANLQQMVKESCYFTATDAARRRGALTKLHPMKIMACLSEEHMHRTSAEVMGSTRAEQRIKYVIKTKSAPEKLWWWIWQHMTLQNTILKKSISTYIQYKYICIRLISLGVKFQQY